MDGYKVLGDPLQLPSGSSNDSLDDELRPTAADIDKPGFTKPMVVRWIAQLTGSLKAIGCKQADRVAEVLSR